MKTKIKCKLTPHDPIFENVATTALDYYRISRSPKEVAGLLNDDSRSVLRAWRDQRGNWNEDKVDKIIRRCKRQRPDLFTRVMGEPAIVKSRSMPSARQQAFALGNSATDAAAFAAPAPYDGPPLQVAWRDNPLVVGPIPVARKPTATIAAKPKTTRVRIQHDGDVLQVIQTPQKRLIISAKSTEASGGKLVAAVAKLCAELGVDVSKW